MRPYRSIVTASLLTIAVTLATTGCFTSSDLQRGAVTIAAPTVLSSLFYSDNNRWPTSRVELADYATNHTDLVAFTNDLYSTLTFDVQTNGSLIIHGALGPAVKVDWTEHLDKPTNTTPSP
jgi:hypothetical protein